MTGTTISGFTVVGHDVAGGELVAVASSDRKGHAAHMGVITTVCAQVVLEDKVATRVTCPRCVHYLRAAAPLTPPVSTLPTSH